MRLANDAKDAKVFVVLRTKWRDELRLVRVCAEIPRPVPCNRIARYPIAAVRRSFDKRISDPAAIEALDT